MLPVSLTRLPAACFALAVAAMSTPTFAASTATSESAASVQLKSSNQAGSGSVQLKGSEKPGAGSVQLKAKTPDRVITGTYSDQPSDGLVLTGGSYIVKDPAFFHNNGLVTSGSGIFAAGTELKVIGGTFTENRLSAIDANGSSSLLINNGIFANNAHGIRLYQQSRITINGGTFEQNYLDDIYASNLWLTQSSTGTINGGTFTNNCYGVRVNELASLQFNGGEVSLNLFNGVQCVDAQVDFNGGNFIYNGFEGAFICSSTGRIRGGTFSGNGNDGVYLTSSVVQNADGTYSPGGPPGSLTVSGGTFEKNTFAGLAINSLQVNPSKATIKDGIFTGNGNAFYPYYSGGVIIGGGAALQISGGKFTGNNGNGVHVFEPSSSVAITGGVFTDNGSFGHGLQVDGGASAVVSGGDFSDNRIGIRLGPVFSFSEDDVSGSAVINGGTFNDIRNAVNVAYESNCTINGGTFSSGVVAVEAALDSTVSIYGGTFTAPQYTFTANAGAEIHLYGKFNNYNVSASPVTLTTEIGFLTGAITGTLQNNTTPQTFTYRIGPGASIVLHPPVKKTPGLKT